MKEKTAFFQGNPLRRRAAAVILVLMLVLTGAFGIVYANAAGGTDSLKLESSTPADGYKNVQAQNVMVKLHFSSDVSGSQARKVNKNKISFTDNKGKKVKFRLFYDSEAPEEICVLAVNDLKVEKNYKITVREGLVADNGSTLGSAEVVNFTTKKSGGGVVYFLLMAAMIVVMVFITIREQRKKLLDEKAEEGGSATVKQKNPYKLAKEKGISVEEANRIIKKERAKEQKKIDKKRNKKKKIDEKLEQKFDEQMEEYQKFRVSTKRAVRRPESGGQKKSGSGNRKKK